MKICVTSYSFMQAVRKGLMTQADSVSKAKELGFDGLEFTDIIPEEGKTQAEQAREIRKLADEAGLPIVSYTISANLYTGDEQADAKMLQHVKDEVDIAEILGAKVMRHDVVWQLQKTGIGRSFDQMLPVLAAAAREITEYAQSKGIRTCTENHGFIAQDSERMERLFNAVGHDNYGLLVDIGNFLCVDEDPVKAVSRLAPYAVHVHCKDMRIIDETAPAFPNEIETRGCGRIGCTYLGNGSVPIARCLKILRKAGYNDWVSIEFEGPEDCFEALAIALKRLREWIAE